MRPRLVVLVATVLMCTVQARAQESQQTPGSDHPRFVTRKLSGPRLGFTIIPGDGEMVQKMKEKNIGRVISQFGWHFEHMVSARESGASFLIEFVPLVGGVEYGQLLLGATLAFGIRLPDGVEFGVGPNLLAGSTLTSALMITVGKTFDFGGVAIPFNVALVTSPIGTRVAFVTGYAIN